MIKICSNKWKNNVGDVMGMMSKDIGIDLGTSNIRIYLKGKGVVLCEPSVVAINKITNEVLAVGTQAKEMVGRTPDNIIAVKPLKDGVIADFYATKVLVQSLVSKVIPKSLFSKPRILISIPSGITDVEERAAEIANYIIDNNATVRQTAKQFGISKSTVHKDGT